MKKSSALLCLLAGISLLSSCTDAMNSREDVSPAYEISELDCGSTFVSIQLATGKEHSGITDYTLTLKDPTVYPANQIDVKLSHKNRIVEYTDLKPDSEYLLEVSYNYSSGIKQSISKTFSFSTKPVYVPSFSMEYDSNDNSVVIKAEKENLANMCSRINISRSVIKDGTYEDVRNEYINNRIVEFIDTKDIEPKTTYYYKFKLYDAKNLLLAESKEPILFNASQALPLTVPQKSLKIQTSLSDVKFEWEEVESADYYEVTVSENENFENPFIDAEKTTKPSFTVENLMPGKKIFIKIYSVNEVGKSKLPLVSEAEILTPKISDVSLVTDKTEVQYLITTTFDVLDENTSVIYTLRETEETDSQKLILKDFTEPVIKRNALIPQTKYENSSSAENLAGYVHMKIVYKAEDGSEKEFYSVYKVKDFYTDGFDAVKNLKVTDVGSSEVVLTFDELSAKQKYNQLVKYLAYAYCNGDEENFVTAESMTSPLTITSLEPGRYYTVKVLAASLSKDGTINNNQDERTYKRFFAETEVATESGLSKPTLISLTEEYKTDKQSDKPNYNTTLNVKWNKINEDSGLKKIAYGIEYKIFEKSNFIRVPAETIVAESFGLESKNKNAEFAFFTVNAGNRYKVRVFAYDISDPECLSYSDVLEIQTKTITDGSIQNLAEGNDINFIKFENEGQNVSGSTFKYSFDKKLLDEANLPRLIFVDSSAITPSSEEYGLFDEVTINSPVDSGAVIEIIGNNYASIDFNMPKYEMKKGVLKAVSSLETSGVQVKDSWLYNNSVYFSVYPEDAGELGFTYHITR